MNSVQSSRAEGSFLFHKVLRNMLNVFYLIIFNFIVLGSGLVNMPSKQYQGQPFG